MIFDVPQTVKPRKPYKEQLPIMVCDLAGNAWSEIDKAASPRTMIDLIDKCCQGGAIKRHPRAILACVDPTSLFLKLHRHYESHPEWNCRVSTHETDHFINGTIQQFYETTVSWFGFRDENRNTNYYYVIAPERFGRARIGELIKGSQPEWVKLYEWAQSIQKFCVDNKLKLSSGAGGIAAQLLRDGRFYPNPRRKVPLRTNERIRSALPGNHYELQGKTNTLYGAALYLDQQNAHHFAAETVPLPNSDDLFARGYYEEMDRKAIRPTWLTISEDAYVSAIRGMGLFLVSIRRPPGLTGFLPTWAAVESSHPVWLYSNELRLAAELGCEVTAIHAAWTAYTQDTGLPRYAKWAQEQIRTHPLGKKWLKSVLLAGYGVLAAKPRKYHFGHHQGIGHLQQFLLAPEIVELHHTETSHEVQIPVANVVQRGMIEAQTRTESIRLARQLDREGHRVLSIYADGILVKDVGQQFPLLPPPWQIKHRLRYLNFEDPTSFRSKPLNRLPGRPRSLVKI